MLLQKLHLKSLLTALSIATLSLGGVHVIANAQGTPGLIIFGNQNTDVLSYYLDFGGQARRRDRYRLRIPKNKLPNGATQFEISYPDYFNGKFDTDKIEVRPNKDKKQSLALKSVVWDEKSRLIKIELAEPLKKAKLLEIVFSNVRNPKVGTYYLYGKVVPATGTPVPQMIGAWVLNINP